MRKGMLIVGLVSMILLYGCSFNDSNSKKTESTIPSTEVASNDLKTATETQTDGLDADNLDVYNKADLETLLGFYEESIDGAYAEGFASRLSVLYTELGAREFLKGLGNVEKRYVKGIAKLLIGERLIEFGVTGREELEKDFGALLPISAMSAEEAKALNLVMDALEESSDWMK